MSTYGGTDDDIKERKTNNTIENILLIDQGTSETWRNTIGCEVNESNVWVFPTVEDLNSRLFASPSIFDREKSAPSSAPSVGSFCCYSSPMTPPSAPSSSDPGVQIPKKTLGLFANALKRKDSFIQFFAMTGILLLSVRSLGQKYRIHDLQEDTSALKEEHKTLIDRMKNIKRSLLHEASIEPTGLFASRLRLLFSEED